MKVTGNYHDMGAFASDVGQLSRIVTLNDVAIDAGKDGNPDDGRHGAHLPLPRRGRGRAAQAPPAKKAGEEMSARANLARGLAVAPSARRRLRRRASTAT